MHALTPLNRILQRRERRGSAPAAAGADSFPRARARLREDRGVALVEFALVAPILFVLLFAMVDFGRALNYWIDATHLANEGARYAAVNRCPDAAGPATGTCIQDSIRGQASTPELGDGSASVTQRLKVCIDSATPTAGQPVTVTASLKFRWLPILKLPVAESTITGSSTMRLEATPTYNANAC